MSGEEVENALPLAEPERLILQQIERFLHKALKQVEVIRRVTEGFVVEDGHITEIGFQRSRSYTIPEELADLPYLRVINA